MTLAFLASRLSDDTFITVKHVSSGKVICQGKARNFCDSLFEVKDWNFSNGHVVYVQSDESNYIVAFTYNVEDEPFTSTVTEEKDFATWDEAREYYDSLRSCPWISNITMTDITTDFE